MVCLGHDIVWELPQDHPLALLRHALIAAVKEHYPSLGMTMGRPKTAGHVVLKNLPKRRRTLRPETPATTQTIATPGSTGSSHDPHASNPNIVVRDLTAASPLPTTSDVESKPNPFPSLRTPPNSPLYTHDRFVTIFGRTYRGRRSVGGVGEIHRTAPSR
ncbi:hypothetical protein L227DRAFT_93199 [Lentinus tigrinus ALCF2SS1-6]|uniref:Uncharacterized protein n=1 Tax=Lentinus tigrinus ALCF2SS1-6 TaxID=1328759 RepID=A0A5C2SAC5_9APHY|nr:hypothetical protein L227DRAFT_93199 [Lentinus tigrinus ALCF2SS1-6]